MGSDYTQKLINDIIVKRDAIEWDDMGKHNYNKAIYDQLTNELFRLRMKLDFAELENNDERISN